MLRKEICLLPHLSHRSCIWETKTPRVEERQKGNLDLNLLANSLANCHKNPQTHSNPQESFKSTRLIEIRRTHSDTQYSSESTDLFRSTDSSGSTDQAHQWSLVDLSPPPMISVLISRLLISLDPCNCKLWLTQTHSQCLFNDLHNSC